MVLDVEELEDWTSCMEHSLSACTLILVLRARLISTSRYSRLDSHAMIAIPLELLYFFVREGAASPSLHLILFGISRTVAVKANF